MKQTSQENTSPLSWKQVCQKFFRKLRMSFSNRKTVYIGLLILVALVTIYINCDTDPRHAQEEVREIRPIPFDELEHKEVEDIIKEEEHLDNQQCDHLNQNAQCYNPNDNEIDDSQCFRAAIYEHSRIDRDNWKETVEINLKDFREAARIAASEGANIIVYPEDGIFITSFKSSLKPALVEVKGPEELNSSNNNPCEHSYLYQEESFEIFKQLSCIAKDYKLYVAANFGTKENTNCEYNTILPDGRTCPNYNFFAYNTDFIFGPDGTYLKRYRKANLFLEVFDKSPALEHAYLDTPFGRLGIITCFDMLFKGPAVDLVEKYQVDTMLFPTLWYDEAPFLTAIQFQDGWSLGNRVNLLAANCHQRGRGTVGSGIYSGDQILYTSSSSTHSRLLIATLPKKPSNQKHSRQCLSRFNPKDIDLVKDDLLEQEYKHKNWPLSSNDSIKLLTEQEGKKTVCKNSVCCTVNYKVSNNQSMKNLQMIIIVRDGLRGGIFHWYEQICGLVTLEKPISDYNDDMESVKFASKGLVSFERLQIRATFTTDYVYPIASYAISELIPRKNRKFGCANLKDDFRFCKLSLKESEQNRKNVNYFAMFARVYERDQMPPGYY